MLKVGDVCIISDGAYFGYGCLVQITDTRKDQLDRITVKGLTGVSGAGYYKSKDLYFKEEALTLVYSPGMISEFLC